MSNTRDVASMMGVSDAVLRDWAPHLRLESVAKERVPRIWTNSDICQLLICQKLNQRGFSLNFALKMVGAMSDRFVGIVAEEVPTWLLAVPDELTKDGWSFSIHTGKDELFELVLEKPQAIVLDVLELVKWALWTILQARRSERHDA